MIDQKPIISINEMLLKTLMIVASSVSLAAAELGRDRACYETSKTLTKFAYSTWNGFRPESMPLVKQTMCLVDNKIS